MICAEARAKLLRDQAHSRAIPNVADDELDGGIEVVRPPRAAVDLGVETVEGANRMPRREQPVAQMRADESCPTGQEHFTAARGASTALVTMSTAASRRGRPAR